MDVPHAVFSYGPFAFVVISFVASVPLAKRIGRRFGRLRAPWERPALGARAISLLAALSAIWAAATAVGMGLLAVPDPRGAATELRVDAALAAHAIPPISARAAAQIADELRRADHVTRFRPPGELERRMVEAARIDPRPERAIAALAARGFRTRAGRFALGVRELVVCEAGLDALADALQGSALQELMLACRNVPGDAVARAAFKMGDFARGVGPEAESIVSRQPRSPRGEPSCFAGGYEVPATSMPVCRLLHAEMVPAARPAIHAEAVRAPRFALLWSALARLQPGEPPPADVRFTIDPEVLLRRPRAALRDQPIAILAEMARGGPDLEEPIARAWVRLAVAAAASQRADRTEAASLVVDALDDVDAAGFAHPERTPALRLALAVALRTGSHPATDALARELGVDDPLAVRARLQASPPPRGAHAWVRRLLAREDAALVADALVSEVDLPEDLGRLALVDEAARAPLRDWVREAFPSCDGCGFDAQLDRLTLRLDAAHALDDEALLESLDAVHRRFDAVVMNRLLALSLRAADAPDP